MFKQIPTLLCDFYKISHRVQYPEGTTLVYSNLTPRSNKHYKGKLNQVLFFGLQYFIRHVLIDTFNEEFFKQPKEKVVSDYSRIVKNCLSIERPDTKHIEQLHDLGYLPLHIKSLREGELVDYKIPVLTVVNTHPDFYWLTNFIETVMSSDLWMMSNNATLSFEYRAICERYAAKTCDNNDHVLFQCHDFSFRGMACHEAATMSGMAHLLSFKGTDTIPAIKALEYYYDANVEKELVGCSIPASEHAVMCAGGKESELETYRRFITKLYPSGLVSIVSDTWDFFGVLTDILPLLKDEIMARDGKVIIRPDSGDPVDIICGQHCYPSKEEERKGAVQLLWETFGGTVNEKGYKVLDPHVGLIYGDSITLERAEEIFKRLEEKGFASSNVAFGVGSYTYQFNSRDSQGWAVKATYCEVNGESRSIFKEPKTDAAKKSAKGLLYVEKKNDTFYLEDDVSKEKEKKGALASVFFNGKEVFGPIILNLIRNRIDLQFK